MEAFSYAESWIKSVTVSRLPKLLLLHFFQINVIILQFYFTIWCLDYTGIPEMDQKTHFKGFWKKQYGIQWSSSIGQPGSYNLSHGRGPSTIVGEMWSIAIFSLAHTFFCVASFLLPWCWIFLSNRACLLLKRAHKVAETHSSVLSADFYWRLQAVSPDSTWFFVNSMCTMSMPAFSVETGFVCCCLHRAHFDIMIFHCFGIYRCLWGIRAQDKLD